MAGQAFYRFSARYISRGQGHNVVGYAAYLSAEKMYDERYGETRRFDRAAHKSRLNGKEILAPEGAPSWVYHRQKLYNAMEKAEKRKDSQLAREVIISFPKELTHQQKKEAARRFVKEQYVSKGMVADITYHNFKGKTQGTGEDNPHAHILLTLRRVEKDGFAAKKEMAWQPKVTQRSGRACPNGEGLKDERKAWERELNRSLEQAGRSERTDCRSLEERGIDRLPQPKLGKAHRMERRPEYRGKTRAGDDWRQVQQINKLKAQKEEYDRQIAQMEAELRHLKLEEALEQSSEQVRKKRRDQEEQQQKQEKQSEDRAFRVSYEVQNQVDKTSSTERPFSQDEREIIRQYLEQQADRERAKPRSTGNAFQETSERGNANFDQKVENLKAAMEEFSAEQERSRGERLRQKDEERRRKQRRPPPDRSEDRGPKR